MQTKKVEVTVGNVTPTNAYTYRQAIAVRSGVMGYSVSFGYGMWQGSEEPSATFTYIGEHGDSFVHALKDEARYQGEQYIMVERSEVNVEFVRTDGGD